MNKFVYFMAVGLAFAALQVATVEASHDQAHVDEMRATEDSALNTARAAEDSARQTMRETEDSELQARREQENRDRQARREQENRDRQTMRETEERDRQTAGGDHHPMMDPRTDPPQPFSAADEVTYQTYASVCESGGVISEASMEVLISPPHNFTRLQVEQLCRDSAHAGGKDCSDFAESSPDWVSCMGN